MQNLTNQLRAGTAVTPTNVIYDIGANNGDDIPYYLIKGDVVVAVEANPFLCDLIKNRFPDEIATGRLRVENCVVTASPGAAEIDFYIHRTDHVLSQQAIPSDATIDRFDCRRLPCKSVLEIVATHGIPFYVKIDIEHQDAKLLNALFVGGVRPPYISAECHSFEVLSVLVNQGGYRAFKLVDGAKVSQIYTHRRISTRGPSGHVLYSFPFHSAGPFGEDIDGSWMTVEQIAEAIGMMGFGWRDVHATSEASGESTAQLDMMQYLDERVSLPALVGYVVRRSLGSFRRRLRCLLK
jgi:FkbM family methyltransferase